MITNTVAEVSLRYAPTVAIDKLPAIQDPEAAYELLLEIWDQDSLQHREEFIVLLLTHTKRCLGYIKVASGGSRSLIVEPSHIFQAALLANAQSLVLAHNHPSGRLKASRADIAITRRIKEAGKLLGISVCDHIILTSEGFYSFINEGLINLEE